MIDIKEIARKVVEINGALNECHKAFSHAYAEDREAITDEMHVVWRAVVEASDAIGLVHDWAIDNI